MAVKHKFVGHFSDRKGAFVDVTVNIVQFKDTGNYIIYAPALEVYGYGKTIQEAKDSFAVCLEEFIDYTIAKGTFIPELKRLGWTIKGNKNNRTFKIPDFSEMLINNEHLIQVMNTKEVRTFKADIPIPA